MKKFFIVPLLLLMLCSLQTWAFDGSGTTSDPFLLQTDQD